MVSDQYDSRAGVSQSILTGRSSNFQITKVISGEIQEINLPPNSEKTLKFCLVRRETELDDKNKNYQSDVYSLNVGQEDQEIQVNILRTQAGLHVTVIRGKDDDVETVAPLVLGKIYSDHERLRADTWSAWLESRHQFKREGPIFLSFSRTSAGPTETELREELERLVRENVIRSDQFIFVQYLKKKMIQS